MADRPPSLGRRSPTYRHPASRNSIRADLAHHAHEPTGCRVVRTIAHQIRDRSPSMSLCISGTSACVSSADFRVVIWLLIPAHDVERANQLCHPLTLALSVHQPKKTSLSSAAAHRNKSTPSFCIVHAVRKYSRAYCACHCRPTRSGPRLDDVVPLVLSITHRHVVIAAWLVDTVTTLGAAELQCERGNGRQINGLGSSLVSSNSHIHQRQRIHRPTTTSLIVGELDDRVLHHGRSRSAAE